MKKSDAALIASLSGDERAEFLDGLSANALAAMPWLWDVWAHPQHQKEPPGDWLTWLIMGGRGAGKTRAGAEWIRAQLEGTGPLDEGRCRRAGLIGESIAEVRAVMVEGESGLLAVSPPDRRPIFRTSQNRLIWPNGAEARLMSASNPESLRGAQFDCTWADELGKWRQCEETWEILQFCLRLGEQPRMVVTTTPRQGNKVLLSLIADDSTAITRAASDVNAANLPATTIEHLRHLYGETTLGRQEMGGEMLEDDPRALWRRSRIDRDRVNAPPELDRIVVAVDPCVSSGRNADACGIVVAGLVMGKEGAVDGTVYVLADATVEGLGPNGWAERVVSAYRTYEADRVVAEVNQGGNLVRSTVHQVDPGVAYRAVRATKDKRSRAEPVAAAYERGRVHHVGLFEELEDQLCSWTPESRKSPDRLDALVWAVDELLQLSKPPKKPGVRTVR